jgi:hypothetical protein
MLTEADFHHITIVRSLRHQKTRLGFPLPADSDGSFGRRYVAQVNNSYMLKGPETRSIQPKTYL